MIKRICVFCGAKKGNDPIYAQVTHELGTLLGEKNIELVIGGSYQGLMGEITNAVIDAGSSVVGVVPENLIEIQPCHPGLNVLHITPCFPTRKQKMTEIADAFLVLPGGYGTLDELFEMLVLYRLQMHSVPIILLNIDDFWSPLVTQIHHMTEKGFLTSADHSALTVVKTPQDVMTWIALQENVPLAQQA